MEKYTPHTPLSVIKSLIAEGKVRTTGSARVAAAALGFDFDGMINVVLEISSSNFFKSMTTHADHTVWQDVYHPRTVSGDIYLKLTVIDDVLIVSFKEL